MEKEQKITLGRIIASVILLAVAWLLPLDGWAKLAVFLVPYLIAGYETLLEAGEGIIHGDVFDEDFLMSIATIGAFVLGDYPEAVFVMVFFQIGELFEDLAEERSRKSITALMDIRPDYANLERDGELVAVDPETVEVGSVIVVKPGEKIPLDGEILEGESRLDTAALTGESVPRTVRAGDAVISGCVNLNGLLRLRVTKPYGESTVSRILEMVEMSAESKSRSELCGVVYTGCLRRGGAACGHSLAVHGRVGDVGPPRACVPCRVLPLRAGAERSADVLCRYRRCFEEGCAHQGQRLYGRALRRGNRRVRQDRHAYARQLFRDEAPPERLFGGGAAPHRGGGGELFRSPHRALAEGGAARGRQRWGGDCRGSHGPRYPRRGGREEGVSREPPPDDGAGNCLRCRGRCRHRHLRRP